MRRDSLTAFAYRHSRAWQDALDQLGATARFTRPCRPQTNGRAERFNRTMADEWIYIRHFNSSADRAEVSRVLCRLLA